VSELTKQKLKVEVSAAHAEQLVNAKEDHISSLTECLLKMKVWAAVVEEHMTHDVHVELAMKSGSGSGALLNNHTKEALRKQMFAVKFNVSFKSLEQERNQISMQFCEVERANEDLTQHIKQVHCEQEILQSETTELEVEKKKLCQDVKKLKELYEENGTKVYRKLMAEDHYQRDIEKKLSNTEEKIRQAAEDLDTYKNAARDLEEKLERTNHYYQRQIVSYEQKAHFNSLEVQAAEKQLKYFMKVNASKRQKLLKMELEFERLERVPYASGIANAACGREHFPHDPSPLGQPSPERNGFLSPPILLEGPLRPPPLLPLGGGQGSRSGRILWTLTLAMKEDNQVMTG
jgi:DNA repair exonuclease SbcCD ATPase subunit